MRWLMKIGDDEYVEWSTGVDEPVSAIVDRDEAVARWDEDRVAWTDKHLCSCRARLGERFEVRNGRSVPVGGGRLAFAFSTYDEVLTFMLDSARPGLRTVEQLRELASAYE